ncbi:MAG TPA: hypothetical protein VF703_15295 [Pyrinomonadaceae bacterium]|jgi:hypothetical protein
MQQQRRGLSRFFLTILLLAVTPQVIPGQESRPPTGTATPPRPAPTVASAPSASKDNAKATAQALAARREAILELESVIDESGKLTERLIAVKIRARAANLLWLHDANRARALFRELWNATSGQGYTENEREDARTEILKNLFARDSVLATKFLEESSGKEAGAELTLRAQVTGSDPTLRRLSRLSQELAEHDPSTAARMLERVISVGVTPGALGALARLREHSPTLADYVVGGALETLKTRPTAVSLPGLHLLSDYVFPSSYGAELSALTHPPDEALRQRYFSAAYEVLRRSLQETEASLIRDAKYSEKDLRFRSLYQGQVALIIAALAPRYGSDLTKELTSVAGTLSSDLPPNVARMAEYTSARISGDEPAADKPELAIPVALARGDIDAARRLAGSLKDAEMKEAFMSAVYRTEFKIHLSKGQLSEALLAARAATSDPNARAVYYAQLARVANQKGDSEFTRMVLTEARTLLANSNPDGLRVRALLLLATEANAYSTVEAVEFLQSAIALVNSLKVDSGEAEKSGTPAQMALASISDPRTLLDSTELQLAFASVTRTDPESALLMARAVRVKPVSLGARLAVAEQLLMKSEKKAEASPKSLTPPARGQ